MSSRPKPHWPLTPSVISRASTIMPAQVASAGRPASRAARTGAQRPIRSMRMVMVVLSPPGITSASRPSRSAGRRTRRVRAPTLSSARTCSRNAPWSAITPTRGVTAAVISTPLPAPGGEQLLLGDAGDLDPAHGLAEPGRHLGQHVRLVVVGGGGHDRLRHLERVLGLEDPGAHEVAVAAELHHECGIGRGRDPAGREVDHRQPAQLLALGEQVDRRAQLLGLAHQLGVPEAVEAADAVVDRAHVADRLDHVAGARLALGADHGGALRDPAQGLAEVAAAADEGHLELVLVDVVLLVGRGQDLGLVDVVDLQRLQDAGLHEVADPALGHHRDGDRGLDARDQLGVAHAGDAAIAADVGGDPLQGHHRAGAGLLRDPGLLGRDDVHDHAALQHLGQPGLDLERRFDDAASVGFGHGVGILPPCVFGTLKRLRLRRTLVAALLLAAGCDPFANTSPPTAHLPAAYRPSPPTHQGGTMVFSDWQFPQTFDILAAAADTDLRAAALVFAPLWGLDSGLQPYPDLVREVPTVEN